MAEMLEQINKYGAEIIEFMQLTSPGSVGRMMQISALSDPGIAFTLYFPVVMSLSSNTGPLMMWAVIFCEWANMILKWVTFGDRPFWWVHESSLYKTQKPVVVMPPMLMQFPRTCETGPGFPCGHTMLNAALFFILVKAISNDVIRKTSLLNRSRRTWVIRGLWTLYGIWILLIATSQIYIATHFPHQSIAGALIGVAIAMTITSMTSLQNPSWKKAILISVFISSSVLILFQLYKFAGYDPMWSVEKAIRWCMRREYLRVDTTPFYSLMRVSGTALGLGLGLSTKMYHHANRSKFTTKMNLSLTIITILFSQAGLLIHQSLSPKMTGWYAAEFVLNAVMAFLITAPLSHFVRVASRMPAGDKWKKP